MASSDQSHDDAEAFLSEIKEENQSQQGAGGGFIRLSEFLQRKRDQAKAANSEAHPFTLKWKAIKAYRKQKSAI